MRLLKDFEVSGKTVFVRADLDVPLGELSHVGSRTRLYNLQETVKFLLEKGAKVVIAGHIDRPSKPDPSLSTKQLLFALSKILNCEIEFLEDVEKPEIKGQVNLLENLRFWEGEIKNDPQFAQKLSKFGQAYVNEAFGNSHRAHASMIVLPSLLPHAAGLHLEQEVNELSRLLSGPQKPFVAVIGGAKIETKLPLVENLSKKADYILVGGELPIEIEQKKLKFAQNVSVATLTDDKKDIDEVSQKQFSQIITGAKTVVWNGPMGLFEECREAGTMAVARAIVTSGAYSVVGGGESLEFLSKKDLLSDFSFVSAGGGAMLEFLAGKELPGLKVLE